MIVAMAVVTTMAMPPMRLWALARVPMNKAEKARLEREEFEAKGFISSLERLLLAVDESANGRFASRLAGLIAGTRGMPITVLPVSSTTRGKAKKDESAGKQSDADASERKGGVIRTAADSTARGPHDEDRSTSVDVTVREPTPPTEQAVAKEAKKGYDLLFVGLKNTRAKDGGFHPDVTRLAAGFEGPLAISAAKGGHLDQPERSPLHILVPVNGTDVSRRAADLALATARACGCSITALYVAGGAGGRPRKRRGFRARQPEQAIMKDFVEMADHYDVPARTAMRGDVTPEQAILDESKKAGHNLIIMGVGRRPGDKLFFGDTAAAIFEKSTVSIVFLAS
jgi:nucleotide-binding universal stress UspA family protein